MIGEIKFEDFKEGERIILTLRRYWATLIPLIFKKIVIFLVILIGGFFLFKETIFTSFYLLLIIFGFFIFILIASFYEWILWYQDIYIITNKRIINIQRKTLFTTVVSEASLDKIQDITYKIEGILEVFFNYGTVAVQTASATGILNLEDIANPPFVVEKIKEACQIFEEEEGGIVTAEDLIEAVKKQKKKQKPKTQD